MTILAECEGDLLMQEDFEEVREGCGRGVEDNKV